MEKKRRRRSDKYNGKQVEKDSEEFIVTEKEQPYVKQKDKTATKSNYATKKKSKKTKNSKVLFKIKDLEITKRHVIRLIQSICLLLIMYIGYSQIFVASLDANRPLSILLVGSDTAKHRGDSKVEKTDSLMVMTFNPKTYKVHVTSIPRDTAVDYTCSNPGYRDQINEAYFVSGKKIKCLKDTVSNFLNVPIDYYAKVDMDQIIEIIDSSGGLKIKAHAADGYLAQENVNRSQTYEWISGQEYNMMGDEALTYARVRKDSQKDYGRGIRQQQVISALVSNILSQPFNRAVISDLSQLVETDMPPLLLYRYYEYVFDIRTNLQTLISGEKINSNAFPKDTWLGLFEYTGYKENTVSDKTIVEFQEFLNNYSGNKISGYFLNSHQFFNEAYDGYFNVVEEQLQSISDALRENLNLKKQKVKVPNYPYGDNAALGLLKTESKTTNPSTQQYDTEICDDGSIVELGKCPSYKPITPPPVEPEQPKPITTETCYDGSVVEIGKCPQPPLDSDGDGIIDTEDISPNGEVEEICNDGTVVLAGNCPVIDIDTDKDGINDSEDSTPNGEVECFDGTIALPGSCPIEGDLDGNGIIDSEEVEQ